MPDLTYSQLAKAVADLQKTITRAAEAIRVQAQRIDEEAQDTARTSEMIANMGVDSATVTETLDLARLMNGVREAAIAYATAGDTTARAAKAAGEELHRSHGGVREALLRSPVTGIDNLNTNWLRKE
ncbi:hypothetical protein ACWY4P_53870 (plasmid) [Streptomyces sp. LZ34]